VRGSLPDPTQRQGIHQAGNGVLEMFQPAIEVGIVPVVLHQAASMRHGGAVAANSAPTSVRLMPQATCAKYMAT
jgi:hypothetical protein